MPVLKRSQGPVSGESGRSARSAGEAWSKGRSQPGKLRVQAQAGLVGRFQGPLRKWGHGGVLGLGGAEAEVASVGPASARTELAALFEGFY